MRIQHFLLIGIMLAGTPMVASSESLPEFHLESSAWRATHIVVATEGEKIDGVFTVIESWKGDLKPGETLTIPELAEFASEKTRLIDTEWIWRGREDKIITPTYVTGARMILFLKQIRTDTVPPKIFWISPNFLTGMEGMKVSIIWIEAGEGYAFEQPMNPGPCVLLSLNTLYGKGYGIEDNLKKTVAESVKAHQLFSKAVALPDLTQRAKALAAFLRDNSSKWGEYEASEKLAECGDAVLPWLRDMLNDDSLKRIYSNILGAMNGAKNIGHRLAGNLGPVLREWRYDVAKTLEKGWQDREDGRDVKRLWNELENIEHILGVLREIKYTEGRKAVAEFRDFWVATPQLNEVKRITNACNDTLRVLEEAARQSEEQKK